MGHHTDSNVAMKKVFSIFFVLLSFSFSSVAQESETERIYREKFVLEMTRDSLQNVIKSLQADMEKERKEYSKKVKSVQDSVNKLQKANEKLSAKVKETKSIERQRDSLQKCLKGCEQEIVRLRGDSTKLENRLKKEKAEEFTRGQLQIVQQIEQRYSKDFDALVDTLSLDAVQKDLELIQDPNVKQKAQQLITYHQCRQQLDALCHLQGVDEATKRLRTLPSTSKKAKELTDTYTKFHIYTEGLSEWIDALNMIDNEVMGGDDEDDQKWKKGKIWGAAMDFLYNYSDFRRYPCLESLFYEIMDKKSNNVDASVNEFKKRLE